MSAYLLAGWVIVDPDRFAEVEDSPIGHLQVDTGFVASGSEALMDELCRYQSESPGISGGDLDADWQRADPVGEEAAGGSVATPDQDVVEEVGEALSITYQDREPLATEDKLLERDSNRWELNPESADNQELAKLEQLHARLDDLDALGLEDAEELAAMDRVLLEEMPDEIDDNLLAQDSADEEDLDALDDDWLLGGLDEDA